ncbi:MAG TPA: AIM24 family protein [Streptosporangiaceae bacterium]
MSEPTSAPPAGGYACRYCRMSSDGRGMACPNCGAPVDVREVRDDSGWVEQPPVQDMARIQFGQSRCQISGTYVPVAELDLAPADQVYFSHHTLLWTDPATQLGARQMPKDWVRKRAGIPLVMMEAAGPGRLAISEDDPGEIIAVPLDAGESIDVVEYHFLAATAAVSYEQFRGGIWWSHGKGKVREWFHPLGFYLDRFSAEQRGLLLLHARGNVFIRDLAADERIYVVPRALVYKDRSVHMNIHMERPESPRAHWRVLPLVRLIGPGRIAIQTQYGWVGEPTWGWDDLPDPGSWRNWNPDPSRYRPVLADREP